MSAFIKLDIKDSKDVKQQVHEDESMNKFLSLFAILAQKENAPLTDDLDTEPDLRPLSYVLRSISCILPTHIFASLMKKMLAELQVQQSRITSTPIAQAEELIDTLSLLPAAERRKQIALTQYSLAAEVKNIEDIDDLTKWVLSSISQAWKWTHFYKCKNNASVRKMEKYERRRRGGGFTFTQKPLKSAIIFDLF